MPKEELTNTPDLRSVWQERIATLAAVQFDTIADPSERIQLIKTRIMPFLDMLPDGQSVLDELDQIALIENREDFVRTISDLLEPLIELRLSEPQEFEARQRQGFLEGGNFIAINQLLSYKLHGKSLSLHVQPNETTPPAEQKRLMLDGLRELAEIVRNNPNIKNITAASWIVADKPGILRKLGFTLDGSISEEERQKYFAGSDEPIDKAHISREELLEKY